MYVCFGLMERCTDFVVAAIEKVSTERLAVGLCGSARISLISQGISEESNCTHLEKERLDLQ